jgi:hypothetical protein
MGLIRVFGTLLVVMFTIGIYFMVAPSVIDPLSEQARGFDSVQDQGYADDVNRTQTQTLQQGPTLLIAGMFVLVVVYAVFRERFVGGGRRRP